MLFLQVLMLDYFTFTKPSCLWKPKDWINQHYNYWKPKLINNKKLTPLDDFNFDKKNKNIKSNLIMTS